MHLQNVLTKHGQARMQQRGISEEMLDLLFEYGVTEHRCAADVTYFNKKSFQRLKQSGRCNTNEMERLKKAYVVECDGYVVTVGHRIKRMKH